MNIQALASAGFAPVKRCPRRLIASIQGPIKSGKFHLALTARKPMGLISIEIGGDEGVVDQFIPVGQDSTDQIQIVKIRMEAPMYPNIEDFKGNTKAYDAAVAEAVQVVADAALQRFYAAYYASLENFEVTVVDTESDLWELVRLANYGRLERIPQLAYGSLNKIMDKLVEDAFEYSGSVFFTRHMKDQGETIVNEKGGTTWRKTGVMVPSGYSNLNKKVQAVIELWKEDLTAPDESNGRMIKFHAIIQESRHNPDAMGQVFENDNITIATIGTTIIPQSKPADWI